MPETVSFFYFCEVYVAYWCYLNYVCSKFIATCTVLKFISFCINSCFVAASYIKFWVSCENHVLKLIKSQQEHTSLHVSAWTKKQDPNTTPKWIHLDQADFAQKPFAQLWHNFTIWNRAQNIW